MTVPQAFENSRDVDVGREEKEHHTRQSGDATKGGMSVRMYGMYGKAGQVT